MINFAGRTAIFFMMFTVVYIVGRVILEQVQPNYDYNSWLFGIMMGYVLVPFKDWLDKKGR